LIGRIAFFANQNLSENDWDEIVTALNYEAFEEG
jgi:hypothetical protein